METNLEMHDIVVFQKKVDTQSISFGMMNLQRKRAYVSIF